MAEVRLSDIIDIETFQMLPPVDNANKIAIVGSGILYNSPLLTAKANAPGKKEELPFWKDINFADAVNLSSDDPAVKSTPKKISQTSQDTQKAFVNQSWSEMNLAAELVAGGTAMKRIRARVDTYFNFQLQKRMTATASGILADNIANDSSDMALSIASESIAGQSATTKFNSDAFRTACYTMGDQVGGLGVIVCHSHIKQQMEQTDDGVTVIPDSTGKFLIEYYKGFRIIMDDDMTVTAGTTDGFKYTTYIFGSGIFGFGEGSPAKPMEIESDASAGNGAGSETLYVRKTWLIHPFGFDCIGTPAADSLDDTELAAATTWNRIVARKNIPMAFLISN